MFWPCWTLRSQCIPSEIWMCGLAVHDSSIIRCPCIYTYGCSCSGQPLWQLFIWNCVPISMYICIFFTHMFVLIDATLASILYVHSICNCAMLRTMHTYVYVHMYICMRTGSRGWARIEGLQDCCGGIRTAPKHRRSQYKNKWEIIRETVAAAPACGFPKHKRCKNIAHQGRADPTFCLITYVLLFFP